MWKIFCLAFIVFAGCIENPVITKNISEWGMDADLIGEWKGGLITWKFFLDTTYFMSETIQSGDMLQIVVDSGKWKTVEKDLFFVKESYLSSVKYACVGDSAIIQGNLFERVK